MIWVSTLILFLMTIIWKHEEEFNLVTTSSIHSFQFRLCSDLDCLLNWQNQFQFPKTASVYMAPLCDILCRLPQKRYLYFGDFSGEQKDKKYPYILFHSK